MQRWIYPTWIFNLPNLQTTTTATLGIYLINFEDLWISLEYSTFNWKCYLSGNFLKRFYLFIFREKGREGEREGKTCNVQLPLEHPLLGAWSATQACALTGNETGNPWVCRLAFNPLSHTNHQESFEGGGYVYYLDYNAGITGVYTYSNLSNCTP